MPSFRKHVSNSGMATANRRAEGTLASPLSLLDACFRRDSARVEESVAHNAAIEIQLDENAFSKRGMKGVLGRWFKGSPRKPPPIDIIEDHQDDLHDEGRDFVAPLPMFPTLPEDEAKHGSPRYGFSGSSDDFDEFSCMSSLSGSKATTVLPKRYLDHPLRFDRNESLGLSSVQDIRNSLKTMELQLSKASNNGERISRVKVMNALFTVADSLEDSDEREILRREISGLAKPSRQPLITADSDESRFLSMESFDKDDWDFDQENTSSNASTLNKHIGFVGAGNAEATQQPQLDVFSSLGKMFSVNKDENKAMENAFDDLLWTGFVTDRNIGSSKRGPLQEPQRGNRVPFAPRKTRLEVKEPCRSHKESHSKYSAGSGDVDPSHSRPSSKLLWLGRSSVSSTPNKTECSSSSKSSSDSSSFWNHDSNGIGGSDDDDDDSTVSSETNLRYLPSNITVKKSEIAGPRQGFAMTRGGGKVETPLTKGRHSHLRVKMVDTENRIGFEAGSVSM